MPATKASKAPTATLESFTAAVRYLLVNEHGMPELVADEYVGLESEYIERSFRKEAQATDVADEISLKPHAIPRWVRVDDEDEKIVVPINEEVRRIIEKLVDTGLYGDTVEEAAARLLCRGVEAVLPVIQAMGAVRTLSKK